MTNSVYAVTGASGHLGRLAVQELLARGVLSSNVVAIARTPGKVTDLAQRGVDVRLADYTRPDTLRAALVGVNRLLLVSSGAAGQRLAQHTNAIAAAKTAGVSCIVYTGILNADHTSNPLAGEHQDTERALRQAGLPFIDDFLPVHNLASLERLAEHLNALPAHRTARRGREATGSRIINARRPSV